VTGRPDRTIAHERCAPGIHRIALPTPWMGTVNAYLLAGDPLTLIDAGPGITGATFALRQALAEFGYAVADLELLIATHHHFDHMGAMQVLAELSGARVACLDAAVPFVEDFPASREREDDWLAALMVRHGVPSGTARAARQFAALEAQLARSLKVTDPLREGDVIHAGGRDLRVLARPGHSPSDTLLHDEADGVLFSGDHLLADVSSNALLALPLEAFDPRAPTDPGEHPRPHRPALLAYRRSLEATRALDARLVLPGHGRTIADHRELIERRIAGQDRRAARLHDVLTATPQSAFALAHELWDDEASAQVFLVLSEVLGHLDLVRGDGVEQHDDGEVIRFALSA
jgi:glyoxylase-like metal-dependent hydrolase (beta-lactamase superfamily II)